MDLEAILKRLEALRNPKNVEGMARFGIKPKACYGLTMPQLKSMAKEIGKDHVLAQKLWAIDTRETRIIASLVDDVGKVTEEQMEAWVKDFDYWEIVDQVIMNLFGRTPLAYKKAIDWWDRPEEFEKRAAFVLMARLAVHDKKADDSAFEAFLPLILKASTDERAGVKKAVNWALRQIGKRNLQLTQRALELAKRIQKIDSRSAKWIAADAIRELEDPKTIARTKRRQRSIELASSKR